MSVPGKGTGLKDPGGFLPIVQAFPSSKKSTVGYACTLKVLPRIEANVMVSIN